MRSFTPFTSCFQPLKTFHIHFLHPFIFLMLKKTLLPDRRQAGEAALHSLQSCLQLLIFFTSCLQPLKNTSPSFSSSLHFLNVKKPLLRSSITLLDSARLP